VWRLKEQSGREEERRLYAEISRRPAGISRTQPWRCGIRSRSLSAVAAVRALYPIELGIGAGAEMQKPLAIAAIGGFSISVSLLLFCLPPLYCLGFRRQRRRGALS